MHNKKCAELLSALSIKYIEMKQRVWYNIYTFIKYKNEVLT